MAYQHRENSGSLFPNDKKSSDKAPNAKGTAMIGGRIYRISAWTREKDGKKWMSLAFEPVEQEQPAEAPQQQIVPDDCPF